MSDTSIITPTYDYHVLLPHASEPRLLLLPEEGGWALPHWQDQNRSYWQVVNHINKAVWKQFGLKVTTLGCLRAGMDMEKQLATRVYGLENHNPNWTSPEGARWASREEFPNTSFRTPEYRELCFKWFQEQESGAIPPNRRPWAKPGWFETASAWIYAQIQQLGYKPTSQIGQLRNWERSCLLWIETNKGTLYFKAIPRMFRHELPLTQSLAEQYPALFPNLLAVDTDKRWMLMEDFGGMALGHVPDLKLWKNALRLFASIQIDCASQLQDILAFGCPNRRVATLATKLDALFADTEMMLPGKSYGLTEEQISKLWSHATRLKEMCEELGNYTIPNTLEHGDFWAGNVMVTESGSFTFFDWSDCSLSHPFFSMVLFLEEVEKTFPDIPNVRNQLRDAYLEPWLTFASRKELVAAFEIAQVLGVLHYALIYYRTILPKIEVKWEAEAALPFYLKMLLNRLEKSSIPSPDIYTPGLLL